MKGSSLWKTLMIGFFLTGGLWTSSCDRPSLYQGTESIDPKGWSVKDTATFHFTVKDTVTPHSFYLKVRNNSNYPYRNIFFFLWMEFPNNRSWVDTVECQLADHKGNWKGSGIGDIMDNEFLFMRGKRFPLQGDYTFKILHAMRKEELPGIVDVGLGIERSKKTPQKPE